MANTVAIYYTDEFGEWFAALSALEQTVVINVVTKLQLRGLALGAPHSSALAGTSIALRELRPNRGHSPLRVVYAFDPTRDAVLILGGDKSGGSPQQFYVGLLAQAEIIWAQYLTERHPGVIKEEQP